jgi:L-idonate 5-dehydrogenase
VVAKELRLIGSFRFDREYASAVAALASGRIDVSPMLTQEFSFAEVEKAFAVAVDRKQSMKVSLRPN